MIGLVRTLMLFAFSCSVSCLEESQKKYGDDDDSDEAQPSTGSDDDDTSSRGPFSLYTCEEALNRKPADCSGDGAVGQWHSVDFCVKTADNNSYAGVPTCGDTRLEYDYEYDLDYELAADNTWTSVTHGITGAQSLFLSDACLNSTGLVETSDMCDVLSLTYGSCEYEEGWCGCTIPAESSLSGLGEMPFTVSGTYTLEDNVLTTENDDTGEISEQIICVEGDTAYLYTTIGTYDTIDLLVLTRK